MTDQKLNVLVRNPRAGRAIFRERNWLSWAEPIVPVIRSLCRGRRHRSPRDLRVRGRALPSDPERCFPSFTGRCARPSRACMCFRDQFCDGGDQRLLAVAECVRSGFPTSIHVFNCEDATGGGRDSSPGKSLPPHAECAENSAAVAVTCRSNLGGYPYARHGQVNYPWLRVTRMNLLDEHSR